MKKLYESVWTPAVCFASGLGAMTTLTVTEPGKTALIFFLIFLLSGGLGIINLINKKFK